MNVKKIAAVAVTSLSVLLGEAAAQNVAQGDLIGSAGCPLYDQTIPGLQVVLGSSGRLVEVSYVVGFASSPQGVIHLIPVIDGVPDRDRQLDRAIGDFPSGQSDIVSFSRVYVLPKGVHTFEVTFSCAKPLNVNRGWLTVKELWAPGPREQQ
jgi:hypothetical protein